MLARVDRYSFQTAVFCLLGGLSLGLILVCSNQVSRLQTSSSSSERLRSIDAEHIIADSKPAYERYQRHAEELLNSGIHQPILIDKENSRTNLSQNIESSNQTGNLPKQLKVEPLQISNLQSAHLGINDTQKESDFYTRLKDGWYFKEEKEPYKLPLLPQRSKTSRQGSKNKASQLSISLTKRNGSSLTIEPVKIQGKAVLDLSNSSVNPQQKNHIRKSGLGLKDQTVYEQSQREDRKIADSFLESDYDESLDDEKPDPDVLEDGQDLNPDDKVRQLKLKADKEEEERKAMQNIQDVLTKALSAGSQKTSKHPEKLDEINPDKMKDLRDLQDIINDHRARKERSTAKGIAQQLLENDALSSKKKKISKGFSIADSSLTQADNLVKLGKAHHRLANGLTRSDQAFLYQVTDVINVGKSEDLGGESIRFLDLTTDEQDEADSREFSTLKAYGAGKDDMITFMQVNEGPPKLGKVQKLQNTISALGLPMLNTKVLKDRAINRTVIVTCVSWESYDFALNWVAHLKELNVTNFLVGALDKQTSLGLASMGIPGFKMNSPEENPMSLSAQSFQPQERKYHNLGRQKVALARVVIEFGYNLILTDVDSVLLKNPTPSLIATGDVDILVSRSDVATSPPISEHEVLEGLDSVKKDLSLSIIFLRQSERVRKFLKACEKMLVDETEKDLISVFNALISERFKPLIASPSDKRIAYSLKDGLKLAVLNQALFCNELNFPHQKTPKGQILPIFVSLGSIKGGNLEKRHRLREMSLWKSAPQHFQRLNGFIEIEVGSVAFPSSPMSEEERIQFHVDMLNYQLIQLRAGISIATSLDRGLIFPEITCLCERTWARLGRCQAPWKNPPEPFICPLREILDLQAFSIGGSQLGPFIDLKENNFLQQPGVPHSLRESRIRIASRNQGHFSVSQLIQGYRPEKEVEGTVYIGSGLSEDQLQKALSDQNSVQILSFANASETFGGFREESLARGVGQRMAQLGGTWQYLKSPFTLQSLTYGLDSTLNKLTLPSSSQ